MPREARGADPATDRAVRWFRWAIIALAVGYLVVARSWPAGALALFLIAIDALRLVARARPGTRHTVTVVQTALTTAVAAWIAAIAAGTPTHGALWLVLLLPVTDAAVRFRLRGAITAALGGILGVHVLAGPQFAGRDIADQVILMLVAAAVGTTSEMLDVRLRELASARRQSARRASLMTTVATAARDVTALDPQRVLEAVTDAALELGFDMAEICVLTYSGVTLVPVVQRGWPPNHPTTTQRADSGVAGRAVQRDELVVVADYQQWEHALDIHLATGIARSAAAAPIREGGATVAVLTVANHGPRELTDYECDCLVLLATQACVALQNAHAYVEGQVHRAQLQERVAVDPLTGVASRDHVMRVLDRRLSEPRDRRGNGHPLTVLFIDIDQLKRVNDAHGHEVGDELIRTVAARMAGVVRPEDTVARLGGDEFVLVLDHAPDDISAVADRILASIERPVWVGEVELCPRVSIGAATHLEGEDRTDLIARADTAMYRAKRDPGISFARA